MSSSDDDEWGDFALPISASTTGRASKRPAAAVIVESGASEFRDSAQESPTETMGRLTAREMANKDIAGEGSDGFEASGRSKTGTLRETRRTRSGKKEEATGEVREENGSRLSGPASTSAYKEKTTREEGGQNGSRPPVTHKEDSTGGEGEENGGRLPGPATAPAGITTGGSDADEWGDEEFMFMSACVDAAGWDDDRDFANSAQLQEQEQEKPSVGVRGRRNAPAKDKKRKIPKGKKRRRGKMLGGEGMADLAEEETEGCTLMIAGDLNVADRASVEEFPAEGNTGGGGPRKRGRPRKTTTNATTTATATQNPTNANNSKNNNDNGNNDSGGGRGNGKGRRKRGRAAKADDDGMEAGRDGGPVDDVMRGGCGELSGPARPEEGTGKDLGAGEEVGGDGKVW